jgi:DNA-binding transcriptional MerR regulator
VFGIGEFSRITELSVRVLRHYDEIGLLVPAYVDPDTGYRHYRAEQLADAHRIVALKEIGLSLAHVQRLLTQPLSTEELIGILRLETVRAELDRDDADRRLRRLRHQLDEVSDHGAFPDVLVVEKAVGPTTLLAHHTTVPDLGSASALVERVGAAAARVRHPGPVVVVAHDTFFDTENLDLEIGIPSLSGTPLALDDGGTAFTHDPAGSGEIVEHRRGGRARGCASALPRGARRLARPPRCPPRRPGPRDHPPGRSRQRTRRRDPVSDSQRLTECSTASPAASVTVW